MRIRLLLLIVLAAACASNKPKAPPSPHLVQVAMQQRTPLFFGAGNTAAVTVAVVMLNSSTQPVIVRKVKVEPSLMGQYSVFPLEKFLTVKLAPGEAHEELLVMTAYTSVTRMRQMEPMSLRTTLDYDAGDKRIREYTIDPSVSQ
jgi:hypothetical protein